MRLAIVLLSLIVATAHARPDSSPNPIRLPSDPRLSAAKVTSCLSWRLAVEVNNARNWYTMPTQCLQYLWDYLTKFENKIETQYASDCGMAVAEANDYLATVTPTPGGKDIWLFDLVDTLISNINYYKDVQFGGQYNGTKYNEWLEHADMPAVPYVNRLYREAQEKGFKIVILSGTNERFRSVLEANLKNAQIDNWHKFILKTHPSLPTREFKASEREQLKKEGYNVIGNVGDQWGDLLPESYAGKRTFKIPNPVYVVE